ncbi:MAG: DMT family transporter [Cyclobacteriaceae bacterium]|nr:DMT family transporter [Cyclobacteriaceae bacterium]
MKPTAITSHLALLSVAILYGVNYSVVKIVTPHYMGAYGFIVYRILFAGIIIWLLNIGNKEKVNWREDGVRLALCGLFGVGINMLMFFKGISLTSAVNGSIIMTLIPLFVYSFSVLFLGEQVVGSKVLGLLMGISGAILIIYQPGQLTIGNWAGDIMIILNALSYSIYLVLVKPLMHKYTALTVTKWIFLVGFFVALPVGFGEAVEIDPASFPLQVWLSIGYAIVGVTVVVYFLNIWAMRRVSPTVVGTYVYVQPFVATTVAVLFFGEYLTLVHLLSAFLIFTGIYLVGKKRT